jgi:hypothetical protein
MQHLHLLFSQIALSEFTIDTAKWNIPETYDPFNPEAALSGIGVGGYRFIRRMRTSCHACSMKPLANTTYVHVHFSA